MDDYVIETREIMKIQRQLDDVAAAIDLIVERDGVPDRSSFGYWAHGLGDILRAKKAMLRREIEPANDGFLFFFERVVELDDALSREQDVAVFRRLIHRIRREGDPHDVAIAASIEREIENGKTSIDIEYAARWFNQGDNEHGILPTLFRRYRQENDCPDN